MEHAIFSYIAKVARQRNTNDFVFWYTQNLVFKNSETGKLILGKNKDIIELYKKLKTYGIKKLSKRSR